MRSCATASRRWPGRRPRSTAGPAALIDDLPAQHSSDDFALMLERVPGCYLVVCNGDGAGTCYAHNPGYDFNDAILPGMASYWVELVRAFLR